ncbi:hypothetical protein [Kribbella sp. NPDC050459]|uniref:hypothetical protein n=1 Tax=Kribbella sp. NPDC050459 TaxID=3155785 RepID=UPI0033CFACB1
MAIAKTSLAFWPGKWPDPRTDVRRVLYCYVCERLVRRLRDLVEIQEAASRIAIDRGYCLGPLFVEEDDSGVAMEALLHAAASNAGGAVVAVPHRGHFVPLGRPDEWHQFLEQMTGHSLVFIRYIP